MLHEVEIWNWNCTPLLVSKVLNKIFSVKMGFSGCWENKFKNAFSKVQKIHALLLNDNSLNWLNVVKKEI